MDHQKTGALIAARRNELGLTQKELATQLNISDRTVSKWERGAGFPDISLLEPLADALGLTLLELFHGERALDPELEPEKEKTVRETVRRLKPEFKKSIGHLRRGLWLLTILLVCVALVFIILLVHPTQRYFLSEDEITSAQATQICPDILISTSEYQLITQMCTDPDISAHLSNDSVYITSLYDIPSERYQPFLQIGGQKVDDLSLSVYQSHLYVDYSLTDEGGNRVQCVLVSDFNKEITKIVVIHEKDKLSHLLSNKNNIEFSCMKEQRDLLFPFRNESHDF